MSEEIIRRGKWTIRPLPPRPVEPPPSYVFTHDDYDGTPDILDPRHGLGTSVDDCLEKISEIEAEGPFDG